MSNILMTVNFVMIIVHTLIILKHSCDSVMFSKYISFEIKLLLHVLCMSKIITIIYGSIIFILAKDPRLRELG